MKRETLSEIMRTWQFAKTTGQSLSECLKLAWANFKLKNQMQKGIVRFYFQKVNGEIREAWGGIKSRIDTNQQRGQTRKNASIQVYFDTEKQEFRSFKKLNIIY